MNKERMDLLATKARLEKMLDRDDVQVKDGIRKELERIQKLLKTTPE